MQLPARDGGALLAQAVQAEPVLLGELCSRGLTEPAHVRCSQRAFLPSLPELLAAAQLAACAFVAAGVLSTAAGALVPPLSLWFRQRAPAMGTGRATTGMELVRTVQR